MAHDVAVVGLTILDILGRPIDRIPDGGDVEFIDEIRLTVAGTAGFLWPLSSLAGASGKVVIVGGGFGGLIAGARFRELGLDRIRIIEKGGNLSCKCAKSPARSSPMTYSPAS